MKAVMSNKKLASVRFIEPINMHLPSHIFSIMSYMDLGGKTRSLSNGMMKQRFPSSSTMAVLFCSKILSSVLYKHKQS